MQIGRDVVFVFGAGASYADGAPLQADILPIIMSNEFPDIQQSPTGQIVTEFIAENFAWDARAKIYPTLETVFGFLDYFISQDEHLSARYSHARIRVIKEGLIKLIHYVISEKSHRQGTTYRSFWEAVFRYNPNIAILTLNYDTLLEDAYSSLCPGGAVNIDYGIHLMNYDLNEEKRPPNRISPAAMKILKGHGSLNWKYCHCCKQVLLTPRDTKINLYAGHTGEGRCVSNKYRCPVDASEFETLIIPPSHIKKISHPVISQILGEAMREIRSCRKVVFVGYSFPDADVHFKALFKKSLSPHQQVIVVNNSKSRTLKYNYLALSNHVRFIKLSFADFLMDRSLVQEILTTTGSPNAPAPVSMPLYHPVHT
ncbi:SIR2 family protein [Desulfallas thermosapovorans]|uniref:SIR2-like protein n=1 Tax=Desulfallas thermosapovorans DSM 6562 TaxID=1121431 RepID=A0A5S4ZS17_9FIRM|nr:SIR2 family protein [Desulfallas thermosapovorans]TYO95541.1 SIR2-like protein [Desulfallas thermosapovorans DSM 6562]